MKELGIGQIVEDRHNRWEILSVTPLRIRVLAVGSYFARYLDVGKEYTLRVISGTLKSEFVAETPPEQMKRNVSQMLLCDFGNGPMIDLTS